MTAAPLAFLHTAAVQADAFGALLHRLAPGLGARHAVAPELLEEARAPGGLSAALGGRVEDRTATLFQDGARVVLCTCSTLGGLAEDAGKALGRPVLRIDRPMAELAVAAGPDVLVVAALESTLGSTCTLLEATARRHDRQISLRTHVCRGAWARFEAGDRDGYHRLIGAAILEARADARVVVLAQASMEGAEAYCTGAGVPVLSSPRSGLQAALATLASLTAAP